MDTPHSSTRNRYLFSTTLVAMLTLFLTQLPLRLEQTEIALLYLLPVLFSATRFGRGPGIVTAVLAFLCSNFFFVAPRYTLIVEQQQDLLQLLIFFIVAIVTSELAGRVRNQGLTIVERTRDLSALYTLSQSISADIDLERILPVVARTTCDILKLPSCQILLYDDQGLRAVRGVYGSETSSAVRTDTPIRAGNRVLGVLQVSRHPRQQALSTSERERLGLIANQIALVVERAHLVEEVATIRSLAESDRLKSVLLSSVSHDLRTPLTVIKGAVTNLLDEEVAWDALTRQELLRSIDEATDRLNRLVGNTLEMSRIEAGALSQSRSWQDVGELLGTVVERMRKTLADHSLHVSVSDDLPLVHINAMQIDQVLTNLLENAAKHTPPGAPIFVHVASHDKAVQIVVEDGGRGIDPGMLGHIFERFVRATDPERYAEGSGLGLAIAKGLVEAHGGSISAQNRDEGGARFVVHLPTTDDARSETARTYETEHV